MKFVQEELQAIRGIAKAISGILMAIPVILFLLIGTRLRWATLFVVSAGIVGWIGISHPSTNPAISLGEIAGIVLLLYCSWRAAERINTRSLFIPYKEEGGE